MRENTDQKNSEYGHFLRNDLDVVLEPLLLSLDMYYLYWEIGSDAAKYSKMDQVKLKEDGL